MPKMKTKRSAAKRFKVTGTGKIKYSPGGNSHFGVRKKSNRKRRLRKDVCMSKSMTKRNKIMI
tara:strand:- start:229 stop:417 length:189 start_codon:yes stop_codon:yes gene_type:complete